MTTFYKGVDPAKMIWKSKPLSDDEINELSGYHIEIEWFDEGEYGMEYNIYGVRDLVRAVEERHGIK